MTTTTLANNQQQKQQLKCVAQPFTIQFKQPKNKNSRKTLKSQNSKQKTAKAEKLAG